MRQTLTLLLVTAMLAAARADGPPPATASATDSPAVPADPLVARVAEQLARETTFQAKLRQRIELFGQTLAGSGTYLQKSSPRGLLLRLEWKLPIGEQIATIQQVSDARFLWIRRELPSGTLLSRVDLQLVRQGLDQSGSEGLADAGLNSLAFGGLPRLLQNLTENFDFQPAQAARLATAPVWVAEGTWKTAKLREIIQPQTQDGGLPDASRLLNDLPPHLPTHVQVVIGQQDLIPYRIDYLRRAVRSAETNAAASGPEFRRLATIEILEPSRGEPLDDQLFVYQPGQQEIADHTELYLRSLLPPPAQ